MFSINGIENIRLVVISNFFGVIWQLMECWDQHTQQTGKEKHSPLLLIC